MTVKFNVSNSNYAVINGELVMVTFKSIVGYLDGNIKYTLEDGTEVMNIVTYVTKEKFESGDASTREVSVLVEDIDGKPAGWTFINGEPKLVNIEPSFNLMRGKEVIYPEGFYFSRIECLKHNTYVEVDNKGVRIEHVGIAKKLQLSEKQMEFVRDFENMLAKAKKMNILFIYNGTYDTLYAANTDGINLCADWDSDPDENVRYAISDKHMSPVKCTNLTYENEETVWYTE